MVWDSLQGLLESDMEPEEDLQRMSSCWRGYRGGWNL